MKKRVKRSKATPLAIAVVVRADGGRSGRSKGDWAAFVGERDAVNGAAMNARLEWQAQRHGPYRILTGVLTGELVTPTNYKIVPLKKEAQ